MVTFLFTDVEGSTRRWEADAEGMRAALAAHDEVLCKAIEAHRGWLFKHTGDGVCAAFASPRSAVDAAWHEQIDRNGPSRGASWRTWLGAWRLSWRSIRSLRPQSSTPPTASSGGARG